MRFFYTFIFILTLAFVAHGQIPSAIKLRCPNPNGSTYGNVTVQAGGNIVYWPCPTSSSIFYRTVDFSHATVVGLTGFVTGTGTTNFIPRWTNGAGSVIGNTPFSWDGTTYVWNNTSLDCTYCFSFKPSKTGVGTTSIGNTATMATVWNEQFSSISNLVHLGTFSISNSTNFSALFNGSTNTFSITNTSGANALSFNSTSGTGSFQVGDYTTTPTNYFDVLQATGVSDLVATATINLKAPVITANSLSGTFSAGDTGGIGNGTTITLDDATSNINLNSNVGLTTIGDTGGMANGTTLTVDDNAQTVSLDSASTFIALNGIRTGGIIDINPGAGSVGSVFNPFGSFIIGSGSNLSTEIHSLATSNVAVNFPDASGTVLLTNGIFTGITSFSLFRTITAAGTTGNQTINKPAGTVNFAAGASALTVTNSTVNVNSIIQVTARTNDATCYVKNYVPSGAGSFVINMVAACTAETSVGFIVTN